MKARIALAILFLGGWAFADELQPLFDGKSVDNWKVRNGTASYVVDDGVIVGTTAAGSPNSFLSPPRDYSDFILEFETLCDPVLNSGVQLRSHEYAEETKTIIINNGRRERTFPKGRVHGYQVEITVGERGLAGGIFDEGRSGWIDQPNSKPACANAFKDNQWNHYRIVARGDHIRTWVNGAACADLVDPKDLSGFLGFQVHSFRGEKPAQVRWRNVNIQDLGRHVWKPLFDGKSLDGWEKSGGGEAKVADGEIVLTAKKGSEAGFLMSERTFDDATVRLEYKAVSGNSGLFFRTVPQLAVRPKGVLGYEVDIAPAESAGGLQEPGRRPWVVPLDPEEVGHYFKPGEWNELVVSFHGGRIVVHVNGTRAVDVRGENGRRDGKLALQLNSRRESVEMHFRRIEVLRPE